MSGDDWAVWMKIPPTNPDRPGYSKIADGMSEEEAWHLVELLKFPSRAMPEELS